MKRPHVSQAQRIANLEWNIRDAREALQNAVAMGAWTNVRKYTAQIEKLEAQLLKATAKRSPYGKKGRGASLWFRDTAGAFFGKGRLP